MCSITRNVFSTCRKLLPTKHLYQHAVVTGMMVVCSGYCMHTHGHQSMFILREHSTSSVVCSTPQLQCFILEALHSKGQKRCSSAHLLSSIHLICSVTFLTVRRQTVRQLSQLLCCHLHRQLIRW